MQLVISEKPSVAQVIAKVIGAYKREDGYLENGDTTVERKGILNDREIRKIREFIKEHYLDMYELWKTDSDNGFYRGC